MIRAACLRYFYEFVGIVLILIIFALLLDYFTNFNLADYAAGSCIGVTIWAAMRTGAYWYNAHNGYPSLKVMLQLAICFSLIIYAFNAILFWLLLQDGSQYSAAMQSLATLKGMKIFVVFALMALVANFIGFMLGAFDAKRQAKNRLAKEKLAEQKLAEKSGE